MTSCLASVTTLSLRGCHLVSSSVDISSFINLEVLDLSQNKLNDFETLKLETFPKLRSVNLSNNSIKTPLDAIAVVIDKMMVLEELFISPNESFSPSANHRMQLLNMLECLRDNTRVLRILDREITLDEVCMVY